MRNLEPTLYRPPLVSCVMPTANRHKMARRAIALFDAQDYPNRELVILDTSEDDNDLLMMQYEYDEFPASIGPFRDIYTVGAPIGTLGSKRNRINGLARGSLIIHWDDDDWYRSNRISEQVDTLLSGDYDIVGLSRHLFHKPETDETWLYTYPETQRPWLAGGTCLYKRSLWERYPFPDVQVGSDTQWIWGFGSDVRMNAMTDYGFYVAMIHEGNTSKKIIQENEWKPWGGDIHALMSDKARVQIV